MTPGFASTLVGFQGSALRLAVVPIAEKSVLLEPLMDLVAPPPCRSLSPSSRLPSSSLTTIDFDRLPRSSALHLKFDLSQRPLQAARILRAIAESYERDAVREDERAQLDQDLD